MIGSGMALLLTSAALVLVSSNNPAKDTLETVINYMIKHVKLTTTRPDLSRFNIDDDNSVRGDDLKAFVCAFEKKYQEAIKNDPELKKIIQKYNVTVYAQPNITSFYSGGWKKFIINYKKANLTMLDAVPVLFGEPLEDSEAAYIKWAVGMSPDDPLFVVLPPEPQVYDVHVI